MKILSVLLIWGILSTLSAKAQIEIMDSLEVEDIGLHLFEDSIVFEYPQNLEDLGELVSKTIKSKIGTDWDLIYKVSPTAEIDAIPKNDNDTIMVQLEGFTVDIWSTSAKRHTRISRYTWNDTVTVSHSYEPEIETYTSKVKTFRMAIGDLTINEKSLVAVSVDAGKLSSMKIMKLFRQHSGPGLNKNFNKFVVELYPYDEEYNKSFCSLDDFNIGVDSTKIIYDKPIPVSELDSLVNKYMENSGFFSDSQFTYSPKGLSLKDFIQNNDTVYICFRRQCARDAYFWTTEFSSACGAHILRMVDNDSWGNITISKKEIYNQFNKQNYRKKFKFKYKIDYEPRYIGRLGQMKLLPVLWNNIKESNQANRFSLACPLAFELMLVFVVKDGSIIELRTIDNLTAGARKYYEALAEGKPMK